jgi:hypothetical protein
VYAFQCLTEAQPLELLSRINHHIAFARVSRVCVG